MPGESRHRQHRCDYVWARKRHTDGSLAAGSTVHSGYLQKTVGIDLKGGNELSLATGHRWDTSELELAEETVVAALGTLTLVAGEEMPMSVRRKRRV